MVRTTAREGIALSAPNTTLSPLPQIQISFVRLETFPHSLLNTNRHLNSEHRKMAQWLPFDPSGQNIAAPRPRRSPLSGGFLRFSRIGQGAGFEDFRRFLGLFSDRPLAGGRVGWRAITCPWLPPVTPILVLYKSQRSGKSHNCNHHHHCHHHVC